MGNGWQSKMFNDFCAESELLWILLRTFVPCSVPVHIQDLNQYDFDLWASLFVCHDGFSFVFCLVKWCIYWKITCLHTSLGQTLCALPLLSWLVYLNDAKIKIMNNVLWNVICTKSIYVIRQDYPFLYIYINARKFIFFKIS